MSEARPRVASEGETIRLAGKFNPAIFQPSWFARHGLLRDEEAETAEIGVIHADVAAFTTPWLNLEVTRDSFAATATDLASHELLRDLVAGTFRLLEHTPVTALGMGHFTHYEVPSGYSDRLGDILVPTDPWNFLMEPKFGRLSVYGQRRDGLRGAIQIVLEPSARVDKGLFVFIADNIELEERGEPVPASRVLQLISERWDESSEGANMMRNKLISLA